MTSIIDRLHEKSYKDPDTGCWLYKGALDKDGYGRIWYQDRDARVHIISAEIYLNHNRLSDNQVNHKLICTNKNCWNPEHLYVGTHSQNMEDSVETKTHINSQKTHCPCGLEYDKKYRYKGKWLRRCSTCIKQRDRTRHRRRKRKS